jgi:nicotinate-nucleotide adenylyltransferase
MRIAICGGTFDPIHRGHIEPVLAVRAEMGWDRVIYMPARLQPFKQDRRSASGYHRYAMAVLATAGHDGFLVSPRELERAEVSYTVDTLEECRAEVPDGSIDWIIGDDNLAALMQWKSIGRILELANFVVLARGRSKGGAVVPPELASRVRPAEERAAYGAIVFAGNAVVPVSATDIRARLGRGEPVGDLVGPAVSGYIARYGLYGRAVEPLLG